MKKLCVNCGKVAPIWTFIDEAGDDTKFCERCQSRKPKRFTLLEAEKPPKWFLQEESEAEDIGFSIEVSPQAKREAYERRKAERAAEEAEWQSRNGEVKTYRVEDLPPDSKLRR